MDLAQALDDLLATDGLRALYQPIVNLDSGAVVGYEALARGPEGSPLAMPAELFGTAARTGRLTELDWACRAAAMRGALKSGLRPPTALFVNIEPATAGEAVPERHERVINWALRELVVVAELTERDLTRRPAELLQAVERLRAAGCRIALDDVGADPRSLALLPVLRPDVVKLDLRLVQEGAHLVSARVANAVAAYAEATGAVVLAEGIETEDHVLRARTLGATLGQGWHFGRPGPLPEDARGDSVVGSIVAGPLRRERSPFAVVADRRPTRVGRKDLLLATTRALEEEAAGLGESCVVVSAFQEAERFTAATLRRYERLAASTAFTAALGADMAIEPARGVRGAALDPEDPLRGEWDIAVLGPHYAAALVAQDLGDDGPDMQRRFRFALTFDRDLVVAVVASLMSRVVAVDEPARVAVAR